MRVRAIGITALVMSLVGIAVPALAAKPGGGGGGSSASVIEYSQCQNGGAPSTALLCSSGWGNGILNSSNSHYAEDQVTPQRLLLSVAPGSTHTLAIRYMTRKGSASAHAYDSLATWNVTATAADACQNISASICQGPATTTQMLSDTTPVPPTGGSSISAATSAHELPAASRKWTMYGGTVAAQTVAITHSAAKQTSSDDYATATITFTAAPTASNVLLLFGGHLALGGTTGRGWGTGLGSANISGGPYHIILDSLDSASVGSRDNQIQASAIASGSPNFTVTKTADRTTASPGDTVNYTITVKNTGTADGATSFTDNFDDRLSPTLPASTPTGGTCSQLQSGADKYFSCTTSLLAAGGGSQTFTYSATMPSTFTTGGATGGCGTGQFPVLNTVTLTTGGTQSVTVCVSATPSFTIAKSADQTVVNPSTNSTPSTVKYTVVVTNSGSASGSTTFTDDYDESRVSAVGSFTSTTPTGGTAGSCVTATVSGNKVINCTTGTIPAGAQQTFTYVATIAKTFSGSKADGTHCTTSQYEIRNTATLANGLSSSAYVCVNASPTFTVKKTANVATANPGDTVTYTIVVTNGGSAAGSTTFTDDFDDRLTPSAVTSTPTGGTCSRETSGNRVLNCITSNLLAGTSQSFSYTAAMPSSFTGTAGGSTCSTGSPQQYAVINTVSLANGGTDSATVCVNASPNLSPTKAASPSVASPGGLVTYTVTVTNSGTASGSTTFTDNFDDRLTPSAVTISGSGGSCSVVTASGDKVLSCTTGVIAPLGGTQTFTYSANMPTTFTGTPGGFGCTARNPHQYPVRNVVVLASGTNSDATVCVNAAPDLHAQKSVAASTASNGDQILTYTISYTNTGPAEATSALVTETVPAGTSYLSCSNGCVPSGSPVSGVSWNVGPIAPLTGTGSVTFTVLVTATQQCQVSNTAYIQFDTDPAVASNTVVVNVVPRPNPAGANASGNSVGAQVLSSGLIGINTSPISTAATNQAGVGGPKLANQSLLSIAIPSGGSLLSTGVLNTTSTSSVTTNPAQSHETNSAEVANVCVVPVAGVCTVEASTVRAVATTTATGSFSNWSSAGSAIQGLKVVGLTTPVDLSQTTTIPLNALVFGAGSYVAINERAGSTTQPAAGQTNGSYAADLAVTMIHVKITGVLLGLQAAEVIVAKAVAHSDFPQTFPCTAGNNQSVSGHAFIASASVGALVPTIVQGGVMISPLGGSESQQIAGLGVPADGSVVSAAAGDSHSDGLITGTTSNAGSYSEIAGDNTTPACVLRLSTGCVVTATLIRSQTNASANSSGASSNATGTNFVGLSVLGVPIAGTPAPNTVLPLLGIGYLVLNEQTCDAGGVGAACTGAHHTGMTVRALHLVVNLPLPGLSPGAEVIVAEAHSDASFG